MTYRCLILLLGMLLSPGLWALEITHGEWKQGAIIRGLVAPGSQVRVGEQEVRVADNGRFVMGLDRDASSDVTLTVIDSDGESQDYPFEVATREYQIQRIEGVPQKTVTPDPEQVARSREEAQLAWRARQQDLARTDFTAEFEWPLTGTITGVYGSQRYFNGEPRSPHYGIDIAAPQGTSVAAPAPGIVTLVHDDMFFSGGTLIIDHGHGLSSTFIHLHKILVEEGDEIEQGQAIAEVGATGRATGPHLDWRMNWFDRRVDPTTLVGAMP